MPRRYLVVADIVFNFTARCSTVAAGCWLLADPTRKITIPATLSPS